MWDEETCLIEECGGELDTGYECNKCGLDHLPLIRTQSIGDTEGTE